MSETAGSTAATFAPAMGDAHNYMKWVLRQFDGTFGNSVLEVGIGHGSYSDHIPASVRYCGLDIDAALVEEARRTRPSLRFVQADIATTNFAEEFANLRPDSILCVNVLEHIEDDRRAVSNMTRILAPGGHLLLVVPALPFLYNELDRLAGHRRRYTKSSLLQIIPAELGTVTRLTYFNSIGALGWLGNKLLRHKRIDSAAIAIQVRAFDKYILPLSRAADWLTAKRFGQSLVAIVRKS